MSAGLAFVVASGAGAVGGMCLAFALVIFGDHVDPFFAILGAGGIVFFPITLGIGAIVGGVLAGWPVWRLGDRRSGLASDSFGIAFVALMIALLLSQIGAVDNVSISLRSAAILWGISILACLPGWVIIRLALRQRQNT